TFDGKVTDASPTLLKPEQATPLQPNPVIAMGGNNSVLLMWDRVDHLGHPADGYVVYREKAGEDTFTKIATLTADKTSYLDDQIKNGEEPRYRVPTAVNGGGKTIEPQASPPDSATGGPPVEVTGAPNPPIKIGDRDYFANVMDGGGMRAYTD